MFTEDNFRVDEGNTTGPVSVMPVKVSKNSRIANPIILDVIPLTVMDATNPPGMPSNVPVNNPFSPPFASISCSYRHVDNQQSPSNVFPSQ